MLRLTSRLPLLLLGLVALGCGSPTVLAAQRACVRPCVVTSSRLAPVLPFSPVFEVGESIRL
jgi:hypothetical protein